MNWIVGINCAYDDLANHEYFYRMQIKFFLVDGYHVSKFSPINFET